MAFASTGVSFNLTIWEIIMKTLFALGILLIQGTALAQAPQQSSLKYNFAELRFVDLDVSGGDGFRLNGSYRVSGNWLVVGGVTSLDFNNNVDSTTVELGAGYFWPYRDTWDFVANARIVRMDVDTPGGSADDTGIGLEGGVRGLITPSFEVRGSVNHINLDNSDTYLELAGDYYFTPNFVAGLSVEFAGDVDALTLGGRWFFQ